jgi:hypothetical protein
MRLHRGPTYWLVNLADEFGKDSVFYDNNQP